MAREMLKYTSQDIVYCCESTSIIKLTFTSKINALTISHLVNVCIPSVVLAHRYSQTRINFLCLYYGIGSGSNDPDNLGLEYVF